jgi:hypothetical protein
MMRESRSHSFPSDVGTHVDLCRLCCHWKRVAVAVNFTVVGCSLIYNERVV